MKKFEINYTTDNPAGKYVHDIRKAKTVRELIGIIAYYGDLTDDALRSAKQMREADFKDFKSKLKVADKKHSDNWIFNFNSKYGDIAMPRKMLMLSIAENQFFAPWGVIYFRMKELGEI